MSDYHFVRWYPSDYMRDTRYFTQAEHGAYFLLINEYYLTGGPLPDDDDILCRITLSVTLSVWGALRPALAERFQIHEGKWHHKRCDEEIANAKRAYDARAKGATTANRIIEERGFKRHPKPKEVKRSALQPNPNPVTESETITPPYNPPPSGGDNAKAPTAKEKKEQNVIPPCAELVAAFFAEHATKAEGRKFYLHYQANGWKVGRVKMRDWHAAAYQWIENKQDFGGSNGSKVGRTFEEMKADNLAAIRAMGITE